ncbi:MAG TPA: cache domain-containing protein [Candidatus Saccharimonadales bacterium]|nr:cache domain-containing protein [Candidatus Saccharimonadales bacterium]
MAALVFFAVFWLYFDAWTNKKQAKDLAKWSGFLLVALSFVVHATMIEDSALATHVLGTASAVIELTLKIAGYGAIIYGLVIDPLLPIPVSQSIEDELLEEKYKAVPLKKTSKAKAVVLAGPFKMIQILPPFGALAIAILYWRRATTGLERHLKPVGIAFGLLFASEFAGLAPLLRSSTNPNVAHLVASFGPLWITEHVFLLAGTIVLGRWVWRYLTERFLSQLFILFTASTLAIFLLTTLSFTYLLMRNIQSETLGNLDTASKVLNYALDAKKAETLANTQVIAQTPEIAEAVTAKDHNALVTLTSDFLITKKQSSLIITSKTGQVLLRAEDPDRWGDSLSSDTLVRRALIGESASSTTTKEDIIAPLLYIKSVVPLRNASKEIVGTVTVGLIADNAFVDGVKHATGLDSALYAANVRSATSFVLPDGVTRAVGVKETNKAVAETVLHQGKTYKGELSVLNRPFLGVYAPIKDADNLVIGMTFLGKPQSTMLRAAGRSIELTFVVAAVLLVVSIIPAYLMAKYLSKQLD